MTSRDFDTLLTLIEIDLLLKGFALAVEAL